MLYSSIFFLCAFLPVVFIASLALRSMRAKNALLIVASLIFYAYGEPVYVFLMLASTLINYLLGRLLEPNTHKRHFVLVVALTLNVVIFALFKYAGMIVLTMNTLLRAELPVPQLTLPIGISFYTFQAISYLVDVYRGDAEPARNYPTLLLYIAFFPQLIAGPIVKYRDISKQIQQRTQTPHEMALGLRRFCVGLAKKVLLANQLALIADAYFSADSNALWFGIAWIGAITYTLQIYLDFSAYSDMAIGLARLFGFSLKENFSYPYAASSVQDFWRRWHISLSTWFKEYVYIPLGGNRKGRVRTALNRLIVFSLCGLWHGANWTFVAWGLFHGVFLLLEEYVPALRKLPGALAHIYTLFVVLVGWVLFRSESFGQAMTMFLAMVQPHTPTFLELQTTLLPLTTLARFSIVAGVIACLPIKNLLVQQGLLQHQGVRFATYALSVGLLVVCLLELSAGGYNPFIYFRF